jgi:ABC-type multidrug transport system ATPase subunit
MSLLALEHVGKQFGSGVQGRVALRDVSMQISPGELVSVWGRRRSGRSTLLRVAAGIEPPESGVVVLDGQDMYGLPMRGLDAIGYCRTSFRPSEGQLILDQLLLGQLSRGVSAATARGRATDALRRVEAERLLAARPGDLDTAERVRVAIARVLVRDPRLLVIDEPTIGVDLLARQGILALLRSLADDGIAVLSSTADSAGLENADRVLSLSDGEVSGSAIPDTASVIPISRRAGAREASA